ncbi:hypothetical protein [Aeromonas veronii]|nr:hypothetical protein [Aeromonas veronii]
MKAIVASSRMKAANWGLKLRSGSVARKITPAGIPDEDQFHGCYFHSDIS